MDGYDNIHFKFRRFFNRKISFEIRRAYTEIKFDLINSSIQHDMKSASNPSDTYRFFFDSTHDTKSIPQIRKILFKSTKIFRKYSMF